MIPYVHANLKPKKGEVQSQDIHNAEVFPGKWVRIWGTVRIGREPSGRHAVKICKPDISVLPVCASYERLKPRVGAISQAESEELASLLIRLENWKTHEELIVLMRIINDFVKEALDTDDVAFWKTLLKPIPIYQDTFQDYERVFNLGDHALFSEMNLKYDGPITQIGPKTITIQEGPDFQPCPRRHDYYRFAIRNWNHSRAEMEAFNREEGMYL